MKSNTFLVVVALFLAGGAISAAPTDDARFTFLKGLAGTWVGESDMPEHPGEMTIEFRLTAGGTAVEEREMAGTPMEMVTLYYMEGPDLMATHYCMLGNQPHFKAAKIATDGTLSFACNGKVGNTASHDEHHVHAFSMRLDKEGRLLYDAAMAESGKTVEGPSLVLTRSTETATR